MRDVPRSRQTPPPESDDQIDIGALLEEVRGMREERQELRDALEELRTARTPTARRRAERDVDAAEDGLVKALHQHGYRDISVGDLEDLRRSRRIAEYDEWFEAKMQSLADEDDDGDAEPKSLRKPMRAAKKPDADGAAAGDGAGAGDGEGAAKKKSYF